MNNEELAKKVSIGVGAAIITPQIIKLTIVFLIGILITMVNLISAVHMMTYKETTATIVDVKYDKEEDVYKPVYEYNYNGQIVKVDGFPTTKRNDIKVGVTENISYNPKNYKQFDVGSNKSAVLFLVLGLVFIIIPGINLYRLYKAYKINRQSN